ncbi:MmgE/PrpD family protein [Paenibacillus koleovorans]|uniref:MmgE/PrpD family protein n=1 Tax=Paenibacillus koleovorans TaxID=121608 RepID=UPI0013E350BF|nr:MmgE/PrpD family protein [Paenibacillus koleovorans]
MDKNASDRFIDHLAMVGETQLTEEIVQQTKMCVLDYIGCTLAGAQMLEPRSREYLKSFRTDTGLTTVVGMGEKSSLLAAAMINGIHAHVAELDDGHRYGMMHPGAPVISAMLAAGQQEQMNGRQFMKGIVVGYEAAIRLASAVQPNHKLRGYHATGTCGTIGVSMAIAAALDFTKENMKSALSAAVTSAAGVLEVIDDNSELKPYNVGRAVVAGMNAAFIGRVGMKGPENILMGKRGFFSTIAEPVELSHISEISPDQPLCIEQIYRKPYAACRHCHSAIEAALQLGRSQEIELNQIKEIRVETYRLAVEGHDHTEIRGISSAKMSTPYSVAVSLKCGKADYQQFMPEYLQDAEVAGLARKVIVCENEELSKLMPHKRVAIVKLVMNDGQQLTHRVDYPKGEPENPISLDELTAKFSSLALFAGKSEEAVSRIIHHVWHLETNLQELYHEL